MRQRIFLGFASVLILFIVIGVYGFWLFSRMGGALEVMVDDSQRWVLAGRAMKESAERMDSTLSLALAGEEEKGRKWFESYAPAFERFLRHAGAGALLPGEGEIANAARHSRPGEDVVLSASPIGKSVRFSVLDHGPGIPKEFQSRIFERFFRIPGTEDSTGVGLGLAIAKEMVVSHGGSIGLQSTSGKGSEFYFDLPAISKGAKA